MVRSLLFLSVFLVFLGGIHKSIYAAETKIIRFPFAANSVEVSTDKQIAAFILLEEKPLARLKLDITEKGENKTTYDASLSGIYLPGKMQIGIFDENNNLLQKKEIVLPRTIVNVNNSYPQENIAKLYIAGLDSGNNLICGNKPKVQKVTFTENNCEYSGEIKDIVSDIEIKTSWNEEEITKTLEKRDSPIAWIERSSTIISKNDGKQLMKLTIKAKRDFSGVIMEKAPPLAELYFDTLSPDTREKDEYNQILSWKVNLHSGETKEIIYRYSFPGEDTYVAGFGPARISLLSSDTGAIDQVRVGQNIIQNGVIDDAILDVPVDELVFEGKTIFEEKDPWWVVHFYETKIANNSASPLAGMTTLFSSFWKNITSSLNDLISYRVSTTVPEDFNEEDKDTLNKHKGSFDSAKVDGYLFFLTKGDNTYIINYKNLATQGEGSFVYDENALEDEIPVIGGLQAKIENGKLSIYSVTKKIEEGQEIIERSKVK